MSDGADSVGTLPIGGFHLSNYLGLYKDTRLPSLQPSADIMRPPLFKYSVTVLGT